jgi:hypothetical protein
VVNKKFSIKVVSSIKIGFKNVMLERYKEGESPSPKHGLLQHQVHQTILSTPAMFTGTIPRFALEYIVFDSE